MGFRVEGCASLLWLRFISQQGFSGLLGSEGFKAEGCAASARFSGIPSIVSRAMAVDRAMAIALEDSNLGV